jgi:hypothetical protein
MIKIKNPIQFPTWEKFKNRDFYGAIETIEYSVCNYDNEKIFANCRWCYENADSKKDFPFTEQGYKEACKWVEVQRINLIEKLL